MRSILLVCTANICRSPTAEGVLRRMLGRQGLENEVEVRSAGTHDYQVGKPAFPDAVSMAKRRGYDITGHLSRTVTAGDFDHFDMILVMDSANLRHLRTIAPTRSKQKIELLLEYGDKYHGEEVPDPFRGGEKEYQLAFDMIEDGCQGLVELLSRIVRKP